MTVSCAGFQLFESVLPYRSFFHPGLNAVFTNANRLGLIVNWSSNDNASPSTRIIGKPCLNDR